MFTYRKVTENGELETIRTTRSSLDAQKYYVKQTILKFNKNSNPPWSEVKKAATLKIQLDSKRQNQFNLLGQSIKHNFRAFDYRLKGKNKTEKIIQHMKEAVDTAKAEKMILYLTAHNESSLPVSYTHLTLPTIYSV